MGRVTHLGTKDKGKELWDNNEREGKFTAVGEKRRIHKKEKDKYSERSQHFTVGTTQKEHFQVNLRFGGDWPMTVP